MLFYQVLQSLYNNLLKNLDLPEYFITSKATSIIDENQNRDIKILVKKAKGSKCERCWKILDTNCERCSSVIKKA